MARAAEIRHHPGAFDEFASAYDADFAHRATGRWLREAVWRRLAEHVGPGVRALDIGCGTGEDAAWLARAGCVVTALDGSAAMLQATRLKASKQGVGGRIATRLFDLNAPDDIGGPFDLVLSNFGALNCAADLRPLARTVRAALAPGGIVAFVAMGRFCAWETLWYGMRFNPTAWRRWRGRATAEIGGERIAVRYWSPRDLARSLGAGFDVLSVHPIGLFLPPSELYQSIERRPRLFACLARREARLSAGPTLARLADHHLTILRHVQGVSDP